MKEQNKGEREKRAGERIEKEEQVRKSSTMWVGEVLKSQ